MFGTAPDAMVARLATCERSGPKVPLAEVPETVWQLTQALDSKTARPLAAAGFCAAVLNQKEARQVSGRRLTAVSNGGAMVKTWGSLANRWTRYVRQSAGLSSARSRSLRLR